MNEHIKKEAREKCTECDGGSTTPCTPCYMRDKYIEKTAAAVKEQVLAELKDSQDVPTAIEKIKQMK